MSTAITPHFLGCLLAFASLGLLGARLVCSAKGWLAPATAPSRPQPGGNPVVMDRPRIPAVAGQPGEGGASWHV